MGLTHQVANGAVFLAEVEHGGGGTPVAHLVDQARQGDIVALAEAAVVVDQDLGHQEQGDALHPRRRVRQPRQHHVDDVLTELVIAAGDVDLVAEQAVAAIGLGFGAGAQVSQGGAGLGLGQAHGAEEAPGQHGGGIAFLLCLAAVGQDQVGGGDGEAGVALGTDVGTLEQAHTHLGHRRRQLHAATVVVLAGGHEAGASQHVQGFPDLRAHGDPAVLEPGLFLVHQAGVGSELLHSHFQRQIQRRLQGLPAVVSIALEAQQIVHLVQLE